MAQNDVIILDSILGENQITDSDQFELFAFEQVLKDFDLSQDEIVSGKTGGADDGGIDGVFILLNGNLIQEEVNKEEIKRPKIDIYIIQAKNSASFSEDAMIKISDSISNLIDLTKDINKLKSFYNSNIIEKMRIVRETCTALATRHPDYNVHYFYVTKGDSTQVHPKVSEKQRSLEEKTRELLNGANVSTHFIGARELLNLYRKEKTYTLQLSFAENFSSLDENYVVLSNIVDYFSFVVDEKKMLRRYIFDSNVRDYQGEVEVNKDIKGSLTSSSTIDFWWLNNGVTILASEASTTGKTISLSDVQIVNGLQTTNCIYDFLKEKNIEEEKKKNRSILVKIIVTGDSGTKDKIIKATNFQTKIPDASLRATDVLQRNIEDYFKSNGWFYDRRKNYYKNIGKPSDKIITIPYLAQATVSILLKEPHIARGRPSSLVKKDDDYKKVFSDSASPKMFLKIVEIMKKIELYLKTQCNDIDLVKKTSFRFHIAFNAISIALGKEYGNEQIENFDIEKLTKETVEEGIKNVLQKAEKYAQDNEDTLDKTAKSRAFLDHLNK